MADKRFLGIDDFNLEDKTVLLRIDINSPVDSEGRFKDETKEGRVRESAHTIKALSNTRLVLLAHQGDVGKKDFTTLAEHAKVLSKYVGKPVKFVDDLFGSKAKDAIKSLKKGDVLLLENVRFYSEEITLANKPIDKMKSCHIVKNLAPLADYFVNDAFAAAHRSQPTLVGFSEVMPMLAGKVMEREIVMLGKAVEGAKKPSIAVLGGAKVDDSVDVASNMLKNNICEKVLATGVVANMFLYVKGVDIGKSNTEFMMRELKDFDAVAKQAKGLLNDYNGRIMVPTDVALDDGGRRREIAIGNLPTDKPIYDLGTATIADYIKEINKAGTVIANGPAGLYEKDEFATGTFDLFKAIANSKGYSVLGGGNTGEIVSKLKISSKLGHMSTGGGACINFLAGKTMPVIEALKKSKQLYDDGQFNKK